MSKIKDDINTLTEFLQFLGALDYPTKKGVLNLLILITDIQQMQRANGGISLNTSKEFTGALANLIKLARTK
jgi:hypothetical protein